MGKLKGSEKGLCAVTIILLLIAIGMAIAVVTVLPKHFSFGQGYLREKSWECDCKGSFEKSEKSFKPRKIPERKQNLLNMNKSLVQNREKEQVTNSDVEILTPKPEKLMSKETYCVPVPKMQNLIDIEEIITRIEDYPHIVSINALTYSDDVKEKQFLCTGTVVSNFWVLTAASCFNDIDTLEQLEIRSSSPYWSKGGLTHKVSKISEPFQDVIALKINPYFRFSRFLRKLEVLLTTKKYGFESALTVGWDKMNLNSLNQNKHASFSVKKWGSYPCDDGICKTAEINSTLRCLGHGTGKPLVPDCPILAGIHTGSLCGTDERDKFVDMQTEEMQNWAYTILNGDKRRRLEIPTSYLSLVFYSQVNDDTFVEMCTAEILQKSQQYMSSIHQESISQTTPYEKFEDRFDIGELKVGKQIKLGYPHGQMVRRNNEKEYTMTTDKYNTNTNNFYGTKLDKNTQKYQQNNPSNLAVPSVTEVSETKHGNIENTGSNTFSTTNKQLASTVNNFNAQVLQNNLLKNIENNEKLMIENKLVRDTRSIRKMEALHFNKEKLDKLQSKEFLSTYSTMTDEVVDTTDVEEETTFIVNVPIKQTTEESVNYKKMYSKLQAKSKWKVLDREYYDDMFFIGE